MQKTNLKRNKHANEAYAQTKRGAHGDERRTGRLSHRFRKWPEWSLAQLRLTVGVDEGRDKRWADDGWEEVGVFGVRALR